MKKLMGLIALLATVGFSAPKQAVAQSRPAPGVHQAGAKAKAKAPVGKVGVQVMVVLAKDAPTRRVDPKLKAMEVHFGHLRYNDYSVLGTNAAQLGDGAKASFDVEGGRRLDITVVERSDRNVRMRVQMFKADKKLVDTIILIERGGTFILAGPQYQGGILLLPITANY